MHVGPCNHELLIGKVANADPEFCRALIGDGGAPAKSVAVFGGFLLHMDYPTDLQGLSLMIPHWIERSMAGKGKSPCRALTVKSAQVDLSASVGFFGIGCILF